MAFLGETFDASSLPEGNSGSYEPLPAGWYSVIITGAELKETKTSSGKYISVRYDITGPTHQGRVVFGNINIRNQNQKAEEIGLQQLGDLMRAIGLSRVTDTDQLINGRLRIKLTQKDAEGDYPARNEVRGFKAHETGIPPQEQSPQSRVAQSNASAPPWAAKK